MFSQRPTGWRAATRPLVGIVLAAVLVLGGVAPGNADGRSAGEPPPPVDCDAASFQALAAADVTISSATVLETPAPVVSYCRVNGFVVTQGPDPTTNHVNFMVSMPAGFDHRYYFVGLGGSAGFVPNPPAALLREGYAVAGSDGGSPTPGVNYSFGVDKTKGLDWGSRGVHVASLATQAITRQYYGLGTKQRELFRYLDGCSGGGRMGNVEALLYPDDYDGVIAGAPGISTNNILFFGRITTFLLENPEAWIPPAKINELSAVILARFDASDGAIDGLIWDPTKVDVDFASLGLGFTPAQIETLELVSGGLDSFGQTYPGFTLANPLGWSGFLIGNFPPGMWVGDPATRPAGYLVFDSASRAVFDDVSFDFTIDMDFDNPEQVNAWHDGWEATFVGSGDAQAADLDGFRRAGGKILFWHGVADNGISANDMIRYYEDLAASQHGFRRTQKFARLFLVPGMLHCGGGVGPTSVAPQTLDAITKWVERGTAPGSLVPSNPSRTFLLCPYPEVSVFRGGLDNRRNFDVNNAENWTCRRP